MPPPSSKALRWSIVTTDCPLAGQAVPARADRPPRPNYGESTPTPTTGRSTATRGKIYLAKVRRHWPDILRVVASIYTGTVRAYDMVKMLQRDGSPTHWARRSPDTGGSSSPYTSRPRRSRGTANSSPRWSRRRLRVRRHVMSGKDAAVASGLLRGVHGRVGDQDQVLGVGGVLVG